MKFEEVVAYQVLKTSIADDRVKAILKAHDLAVREARKDELEKLEKACAELVDYKGLNPNNDRFFTVGMIKTRLAELSDKEVSSE